jgi:hypothetical protein
MGRWLLSYVIALVLISLFWPRLARLGLGRLPGDIRVERGGQVYYFPITSSLLLSVLLNLLL